MTERARHSLLLEGVPANLVEVAPPGIDRTRFRPPEQPRARDLVLSVGRLVWEKGHLDVIRAIAALHRGLVPGATRNPRLLIVGAGPEERRVRGYADELGLGDDVRIQEAVPYDDMPSTLGRATCLVLASLPTPTWEEQFGMVLAEALSSGVPVIGSTAGAIPEVIGRSDGLFSPGDWMELARLLADGPLSDPLITPRFDDERVNPYSTEQAAARLQRAYHRVLAAAEAQPLRAIHQTSGRVQNPAT